MKNLLVSVDIFGSLNFLESFSGKDEDLNKMLVVDYNKVKDKAGVYLASLEIWNWDKKTNYPFNIDFIIPMKPYLVITNLSPVIVKKEL